MASPRLPIPGDDGGTWGEILNEYLLVSHNGDGTLKAGVVPVDVAAKADKTYVDSELATKADSTDLSTVATSGSYNDLLNKPNFVLTNDARLSDTRTPTDGTVSTNKIQDSSITEPKLAVSNAPTSGQVLTWSGSDLAWQAPGSAPVSSVAGKTGVVSLVKGDVGLTNVDNTSDLGKPISTAVQAALNDKSDAGALAQVATTGDYADLTNVPTIPSAGTSGSTYAVGNDARITGALQTSTVTTKGDLLAATGSGAINRLGVGSNGQVLEADSTQATGVKWSTPVSAPVQSVAGKTGVVTLTSSDVSGLSTIATTGAYADISGTPTIPTAGTSGSTYAVGNDARITGALQTSTVTTKGDLLAATGSGAINRLGVGSNGQVLEADSSQATGVKWSTPVSAPVASVAGKTGVVTLTSSDVSGFSTVATSGAYADLTGKPTLSTVAASGAYADLTGQPTIPTAGTSGSTYAAGNDARIIGAVQISTVTTKGDLLVAAGNGSLNRVGAGTNGQILTVDSAEATGVKWTSLAAGTGIIRSIVTVSSNQTAGADAHTDYVYIISGNYTLTLPTAVGNSNQYTIKNRHSANVTLAFNASETADGGGITLGTNNSVDLVSDGSNWVII